MAQARDGEGHYLPLLTIRDRDLALLRYCAQEENLPPEWEEMADACGYDVGVMRVQFHRFQKLGLIGPDGGITPLGLQALVLLV